MKVKGCAKAWPLFLCPKVDVLSGHLDIVMMLADVFDTLTFQFWDTFGMEHKVFQCLTDTLVGGLDIDDGVQFGLVDYLIVLRLTASDADDAFRHCEKGIHGWGIGIELIKDGIGAFHHLLIFCKGNRFCYKQFHTMGILVADIFCCTKHNVGAFVDGAFAVDAEKDDHL